MKYYIITKTKDGKIYKKPIKESEYWKLPLYATLITGVILSIGLFLFIAKPLFTMAMISILMLLIGVFKIKV